MKKFIKENYYTVYELAQNLRELKFNLTALFLHIFNNIFRLNSFKPIEKIHFGSGTDNKKGFLNIDLNGEADIFLDVRNKLNIPPGSVSYIYSSHFVEHLSHAALVFHLKECCRILRKGGVLRVGVPDFESLLLNYERGSSDRFEEMRELLGKRFGLPTELVTYMDQINRGVYEFGAHKTVLDFDKFKNLLIHVGFDESKIMRCEFDEVIDPASRKGATIYIEVVKQ
jgi:SAM-dependent methyltransferase